MNPMPPEKSETKTPIDDGGPAFPLQITHGDFVAGQAPGLSVRDWFAGQAMAGLLASNEYSTFDSPDVGAMAYTQADAMIAARTPQGETGGAA